MNDQKQGTMEKSTHEQKTGEIHIKPFIVLKSMQIHRTDMLATLHWVHVIS